MYDRDKYFSAVRDNLFDGSMSQSQVDGQNTIISVWEFLPVLFPDISFDPRWLAYMLATTFHETAATFQPVTEYGSTSYLQGKPYYPYIGRGYVQLTWDYNYEKATNELSLGGPDDLVAYPDRALDPVIAAKVLFKGMYEGWFTGKKLTNYFNDDTDDPVNARQIINGNDDDELIAGYHTDFLNALDGAWTNNAAPQPPPSNVQHVKIHIQCPPGVVIDVVIEDMDE